MSSWVVITMIGKGTSSSSCTNFLSWTEHVDVNMYSWQVSACCAQAQKNVLGCIDMLLTL